jgi:hypothetical protein
MVLLYHTALAADHAACSLNKLVCVVLVAITAAWEAGGMAMKPGSKDTLTGVSLRAGVSGQLIKMTMTHCPFIP